MVKICHSFVLIAAAHASEDGEAMLQVGKNAPALAQTDATVHASRQQQALQMESNFEKLAAEAVRTGVTPSLGADARSAVNSALDTLEDELEKEKIANDAEMVGANAQCANCNKAQKDAFKKQGVGVDAMKSVVEEARSQHAACRGKEDPNCGDEKTKCVAQNTYARKAHGAGPQCCDADDTAEAMKECLQKALDWGSEYNTVLGDKISACDSAKEVAKKVAEECDKDQTNFEMAFCTYQVSLTTTCQSHNACYEAAVRSRGIVMINLKAKEASEKIMWKSCKKVRCYLDMLDATQVSQEGFDACKKLETDTAHLDVTYPAAPAKEVCDTTPVNAVPGDATWLEAEYAKLAPNKSWLPRRNGIEDVTPCPKPAVTAIVGPAQPKEYTHKDCRMIPTSDFSPHRGNCALKTSGSWWPKVGCQDQGARQQAEDRCWQSSLAKAKAICDSHPECIGVTRDNGGFEPRGSVTKPAPYYHGSAHEMWLKSE